MHEFRIHKTMQIIISIILALKLLFRLIATLWSKENDIGAKMYLSRIIIYSSLLEQNEKTEFIFEGLLS